MGQPSNPLMSLGDVNGVSFGRTFPICRLPLWRFLLCCCGNSGIKVITMPFAVYLMTIVTHGCSQCVHSHMLAIDSSNKENTPLSAKVSYNCNYSGRHCNSKTRLGWVCATERFIAALQHQKHYFTCKDVILLPCPWHNSYKRRASCRRKTFFSSQF